MAKRRDFGVDIKGLEVSDKLRAIISDFLEIECSPSQDLSPKQARKFRKIIIRDIERALDNDLKYSNGSKIPLWHKLHVVGIYYLGKRQHKLSHLLRSLSHLVGACYKKHVY
jgi:hypothetical protein